jgi:hypothetical protein
MALEICSSARRLSSKHVDWAEGSRVTSRRFHETAAALNVFRYVDLSVCMAHLADRG